MTSSARTFLNDAKRRCLDCGGSRLWKLAVTHPSVSRSGQLSLWRFGSTAIDLALTWNQLQAGLHRDSATLTRSLAALRASTAWLDSLLEDGSSFFVVEKGLSTQGLSHQIKMQFVSSVIGACFCLDENMGLDVVRQHLWKYYPTPTEGLSSNPKSQLQQYAQAKQRCIPIYVVVNESGPDHDKLFCVSVSIPGRQLITQGKGTTKKLAENNAARTMLDALGIAPPDVNSGSIKKNTENRGSVVSTHSLHSISDGEHRQQELREGVFQFIEFIKKRLGVDLKYELAEIVMSHSSLGSPSGLVGPKATGLTLLGNLAYEYCFLLEILRNQQIEQISGTDLPARILSITQMLFNNLYKIRLADGLRSYIRTSSGTPRPLSDSIVLDAFEGSIGAAVVVDFGALAEIRRCLRDRAADDVDLTDLSLEPTLHQDFAGTPKTLLQQLFQFVHPGKAFILSQLLLIEIVGPADSSEVVCKVKGDLEGRFDSVASRKKAAIAACSECILKLICCDVESSVRRQSGIGWIDSLVDSLRNSLFDNPLVDTWRSALLQRLPFAERTKQSILLIGEAMRHPSESSFAAAIEEIGIIRLLGSTDRSHLQTMVQSRLDEYRSAAVVKLGETALASLISAVPRVTADSAIQVICTIIHALKALKCYRWQGITGPEVLSLIPDRVTSSVGDSFVVPARVAFLDRELLATVLQQMSPSVCLRSGFKLLIDDSNRRMLISSELDQQYLPLHRPLFVATWERCRHDDSGFAVVETESAITITIPFFNTFTLSSGEIVALDGRIVRPQRIQESVVLMESENICVSLHEIKNRIIASRADWLKILDEIAAGLRRTAKIMRAPVIAKHSTSEICEAIREALNCSSKTYGANGTIELLHDGTPCYVDAELLEIVLRNLCDNAARAAGTSENPTWGISCVITRTELELHIWNPCVDIVASRTAIEGDCGRSSVAFGTGVGIRACRRILSKMMGRLEYRWREKRIWASVTIPVDLATVSWGFDSETAAYSDVE